MKKQIIILITLVLMLSFSIGTQAQEKKIKEEVSVLNIEVPVRVFYKDKLVDNLTKNDFSLIVNGKERKIIHFDTVRKQIETQEMLLEKEKEFPPRYFVIAVNITNFDVDVKKGIVQIVDRMMRKNDAMLIFINKKSLTIKNFQDKTAAKEKIFDLITEESIEARKRMLLYFKQLEGEIDFTKFKMTLRQTAGGSSKTSVNLKTDIYNISDFLRKYLIIWKDYKNKYLIPDVKTYLLFSKHLQKIPVEKWVISLNQQELFPRIVMKGDLMRQIQALIYKWQQSTDIEVLTFARSISKLVNEIRKELNISKGFPTEEITKIFTKVGATFHSIFINTIMPTFSKDMEYKRISTDLENNLRSLTEKTGGELITSRNLEVAIDKIVKKQDIFYVLTYVPKDGEKIEKLKIKVHKRKHKPIYDDNVRTEFTKKPSRAILVGTDKEIKIDGIEFKDKKLSFKVTEFSQQKTTKGITGSVNVRIQINNMQDNPVFDKNNNFNTKSKESNISLDFKWLKKGRYEIVIEAKDNYTGRMASDFIQIKVE
ncbi:MAG: hypothetical protein ABFR36_06095 [Acidobacteriota bacterium]